MIKKNTERLFPKQLEKERSASVSSLVHAPEKYKIDISSDNYLMQEKDIKKLLINNGIHFYNVQEKANWTNGNENNKLIFEIRDTEGLEEKRNKLIEKGIVIERIKTESTVPEKKPDMFPVQAKWNDVNIRAYHVKMENEKKPQQSDHIVKDPLKFDPLLVAYKNDRMHSKGRNTVSENASFTSLSRKSEIRKNETMTKLEKVSKSEKLEKLGKNKIEKVEKIEKVTKQVAPAKTEKIVNNKPVKSVNTKNTSMATNSTSSSTNNMKFTSKKK